MEILRPAPTTIPIVLSREEAGVDGQCPQPSPSSRSKVIEPIQTIKSVDSASDTEMDASMPKPTRSKSDPPALKRADSPHFWKPTKASRARSQATRGKSSRKSTSSHHSLTTLFQSNKKNAENEEAVTMTVQPSRTDNKPGPSDLTEIYVVLQYDALFPHCKAHGVFKNVVDANNKVIELYNEDEAQRGHGENRGKVQPYISENGCLQYYRTKTDPKSMVWVTRAPLCESMAEALVPWPNEVEMKMLWVSTSSDSRRAAGWTQKP